MYKRIREHVANQTRPNLGFADVQQSKGIQFTGKNTVVDYSNDPSSHGLRWDKYYYIHRRAIRSTDNNGNIVLLNKFFVPMLDWHYMDPSATEGIEYNFFDYDGTINKTHTRDHELGVIYDQNLPQDSNIAYGIYIPPKGGRPGSIPIVNLPIVLLGDDVSCSVFTHAIPGNTPVDVIEMVYSSNVNNLTAGSPVDLEIPVYPSGIYIWIMIYKHYFPDDSPIFGKSFFRVNVDLTVFEQGAQSISFANTNAPEWYSNITTSANPITGNIINTLRIQKPSLYFWRGASFYRIERELLSQRSISTNNFANSGSHILISTSNSNVFKDNSDLIINNTVVPIQMTFNAPKNYVINGDFSWFNGSLSFSNWVKTASVPATVNLSRVTSYPNYSDYYTPPNSALMMSHKTETAKSYYMYPNVYLPLGITKPILNFRLKQDSGRPTGMCSVYFYSSNDGTQCFVKTKNYEFNTTTSARDWTYHSILFTQNVDSTLPNFFPYGCKYIRPRFYSSFNSTSYSVYYLDGVYFGEYSAGKTFHTTQSNKIIVKSAINYEAPHTNLTGFNAYFQNTTKSWNFNIYGNKVFNRPQYISSTYAKFNYGLRFVDSARNHIVNGDFGGKLRLWTTANANIKLVQDRSLYKSTSARLYGNGLADAYIRQSFTGGRFAGDSAFCLAIWAKSPIFGQRVKLKIDNQSTQISSAHFTLTTSWAQYTVRRKFTNAGDNVRAWVMVPTSRPWVIQLAGVQLEAKKDYITDFNYLSTTGASVVRRFQGIEYNSNVFSTSYGTIRFWYKPNLRSNTGAATRTFYHNYRAAASFEKITYSKSDGKFIWTNHSASASKLIHFSTSFSTAQNIHIVCTWATSRAYMYVNNVRSSTFSYKPNSLQPLFYVGCDRTTVEAANGVISNFRVDKYAWSKEEVANDFYATHITHDTNKPLKKDTYTFIGSVFRTGDENQDYIEFKDDNGVEPETQYYYTVANFDINNNESLLSTVKSIYVPRTPFEYYNVNLINNASFEFKKGTKCFPWATVAGGVVAGHRTTAYSIFGNYSVGLADEITNLQYEYVYLKNTAVPFYISWYSHKPDNADEYVNTLGLVFYNKNHSSIGTLTVSDFTTSGALDRNERYWKRFSTAIGYSNLSVPVVTNMKFVKLIFLYSFGFSGANYSYIDGVQFEQGQLRAFRENPIVDESELGSGVVDSNILAWDTIVGKHFVAREILVSGGDNSKLNRIVIGKELKAQSFSVLSTAFFKWHSPGLATTSGWNYTKHIESGIKKYGDTVTFATRYTNWNGQAVAPLVFLAPHQILTFATVNMPFNYSRASIYPQKFRYSYTATPSGFTTKGEIYTENTGPTTVNFTNFNVYERDYGTSDNFDPDSPTTNNHGESVQPGSVGNIIIQAITTVLPSESKGVSIFAEYETKSLAYGSRTQGTCLISFYCSSKATRAFTTAAGVWYKLDEQYHTLFTSSVVDNAIISSNKLNGASSFAMMCSNPIGGPSSGEIASFKLKSMYYYASSYSVLKTDSAIGTFSYLAIDGGVIG